MKCLSCFMESDKITCNLCAFLLESNKIEGIERRLFKREIKAARSFLELKKIRIADLCHVCNAFELGTLLRTQPGMDVTVGDYNPPLGGPGIADELTMLLKSDCGPFNAHKWFEALHPFTDGNGRTGRMYWYWQMQGSCESFLQTWYFHSLQEGNE